MANITFFELVIKGDRNCFGLFKDSLNVTEIYDAYEEIIGDNAYLTVSGETKYFLDAYCKKKAVKAKSSVKDSDKLRDYTLKAKSKLLCADIELFEIFDDGNEVSHVRYREGDSLVEEKISLNDIKGKVKKKSGYYDFNEAFSLKKGKENVIKYGKKDDSDTNTDDSVVIIDKAIKKTQFYNR